MGNVKNNISLRQAKKDALKAFNKKIGSFDFSEIHLLEKSNLTIFAIILAIIENFEAKKIYIASYRIDTRTAKLLKTLHHEVSLKVIIQQNIVKLTPKIYEILKDKVNLSLYDTHAKIGIISTEKHNFVILSSANINSNERLEDITIIKDNAIFDDYLKWFETFDYKIIPQIKDRVTGKHFSSTYQPREKWTDEKILEIGKELVEFMREEDNLLFEEFLVFQKGLYPTIINYFVQKCPPFSNYLRIAKKMQKIKLQKNGLLEKTNPRFTQFILNTSHGVVEKKFIETENKNITDKFEIIIENKTNAEEIADTIKKIRDK